MTDFLDAVLDETVAPTSDVHHVTADYSNVTAAREPDQRISREWASRPDDERYTSIEDLDDFLTARRSRSTVETIKVGDLKPALVNGSLMCDIPGVGPAAMTHRAFGQLCTQIRAPADYLRRLSNPTAATCMTEGFDHDVFSGVEAQVLLEWNGSNPTLRAMTGAKYGRIWDNQVSGAMREAAARYGLTVPTAFRTAYGPRNAAVARNVGKNDTTLYAGDRDVVMFMVDESRPIEAGKLANGHPRLFFRGMYVLNGETGERALRFKTFLYEYVCCNRMIWGQAGVEEFSRKHTKNAPEDFVMNAVPAMMSFLQGSVTGIQAGLIAAQQTRLPQDDKDLMCLLGLTLDKKEDYCRKVLDVVLAEEGRKAETIFDILQGVTAMARDIPYAHDRLLVEQDAGTRLLEKLMVAV